MTDCMFLMQRYWGSDDEDLSETGNTDNVKSDQRSSSDDEQSPIPKKKKIDYFDKSNEELNNFKSVSSISNHSCHLNEKGDELEDFDKSNNELRNSKHISNSSNDGGNLNEINIELKLSSKKLKEEKSQNKKEPQNNTENESSVSKLESSELQSFSTIGQVHHQKNVKIQRTLPNWLCNPTYINVNLQEKEFPISELSYLDPVVKNTLEKAGINFLFPVQLAVIPWLMHSKEKYLLFRQSDICVSAPTGSGKTLAFVIPIVQSLKDRVICAIRALIVLPVCELAVQVFKVFKTFIQGTDLKVVLITGQNSFLAEQNSLVKIKEHSIQSLADIVIVTPGRVYDHIYKTNGFCLKRLRYLVIDEADRLMEEIQQGWLKLVEDAVYKDCRSSKCVCCFANERIKRVSCEPSSAFDFGNITPTFQKLLYSATLTHDPEKLHILSLYKPKLFTAKPSSSKQKYIGTCAIPSELNMLQVICNEGIKPIIVCYLIEKYQFKKVLCFTNSVERAHRLHLVLEEMKLLKVREISSLNKPAQRKIVLEQFSSGKVNVLVCTDLVARGMDIENVDCVISYDIPVISFMKDYVHRIGRTARAGKTGTSIALLPNGKISHFKELLKSTGIEVPHTVDVSSKDLKPYMQCYQDALLASGAKLKKENTSDRSKPKNNKRKR